MAKGSGGSGRSKSKTGGVSASAVGGETKAASAPTGAAASSGTPAERAMATLDAATKKEGEGSLIAVRVLREQSGLPKADFDREMLKLYNADKIILHHFDHVASYSEKEREDKLIKDDHGNYFIGANKRGAW